VLQLLGVATVAWGISETRALFGRPSLSHRIIVWLNRFPLWRRNIVIELQGIAATASVGRASAHVVHSAAIDATIEARVAALEKNIASVHDRIGEIHRETREELQNLVVAVSREERGRLAEDEQLRRTLEAASTGGIHISAIGALWIFVGLILSTAAPEIAALLK